MHTSAIRSLVHVEFFSKQPSCLYANRGVAHHHIAYVEVVRTARQPLTYLRTDSAGRVRVPAAFEAAGQGLIDRNRGSWCR
jgi:hypothetical protein